MVSEYSLTGKKKLKHAHHIHIFSESEEDFFFVGGEE